MQYGRRVDLLAPAGEHPPMGFNKRRMDSERKAATAIEAHTRRAPDDNASLIEPITV
jgi:hypothetical protein